MGKCMLFFIFTFVVFELNYAYFSDSGMIAPEDYFSPDHFIRRDVIKDSRAFWSKMLEAAAGKMNQVVAHELGCC